MNERRSDPEEEEADAAGVRAHGGTGTGSASSGRPHEPGESVADDALAEMLDVALALVEQSTVLEPAGPR